MKVLQSILVVSFTLLTISSANAQYGIGNNGGTDSFNNRTGQPTRAKIDPDRYKKSDADIEKEKIESTNKTIEQLKKDLNLDELQLIIVRKEIEDSNKKIYALLKNEEISNELMAKEFEAITDKMDTTIFSFLNKEQKAKYKKVVEDRKEKMDKIKSKQ